MLKLIVAVADGWAIGYKGDLLARISTDLKRFKELTTGNAVIMGYNTLISLPGSKPLKNRENIVLYPDEIEIEGASVVHSLKEAADTALSVKDKDCFVIGGGSVYNQLLPYCDTAYITKIDRRYEADTFIPNLDEMPEWYVDEESEQYYDTDGTPYRYVTYKRKKIMTFIGAGLMSSSLSVPAADNGVTVRIVGLPFDEKIIDELRKDHFHKKLNVPINAELYKFEELDKALEGVYDVVCGVSSFGVEWFAKNVLPRLKPGMRVLSVTKGLLDNGDGTITTYPDYFAAEAAEGISFAAVGGACTSHELANRNHTLVTYCGREKWVAERFRDLLQTDYYHVNVSDDLIGVEVAVALKNAYALAISAYIGTENRDKDKTYYNSEATLFTQSVREMNGFLRLFGAGEDALNVGAGDIYITVMGGRTRRLGLLLGEGKTVEEAFEELKGVTLESAVITERIYSVLCKLTEKGAVKEGDYPLIRYVAGLLLGEHGAKIPWDEFSE